MYKKTTTATDEFPIFGYDKGDFVKIYQPLAPKGDNFLHKHSFIGQKIGSRIIYGWDRLFKKVNIGLIEVLIEEIKQESNEREKRSLSKI